MTTADKYGAGSAVQQGMRSDASSPVRCDQVTYSDRLQARCDQRDETNTTMLFASKVDDYNDDVTKQLVYGPRRAGTLRHRGEDDNLCAL